MSPTSGVGALFDRFYFFRPDFVNGTTEFHAMCRSRLSVANCILEIGAGPTNRTTEFLSTLARVVGLDVSYEARANDALTEVRIYDGRTFPFPDQSFDGCVSNYVLEHVENTDIHFREVARVLRRGGTYLFRTPNLCHYVALASWALPHFAHVILSKRLRAMKSENHDPWVTYYRANTAAAIRARAQEAGLEVVELRMVEKEPSYGRAGAAMFYPLMVYERVVNATSIAAPFRANIFGILRRPE